MNTVDVICEAENLPRIRLLQSHMQSLKLDLQIHDELPETHSPRIIYVPRRQNSKFQSTPAGADFERIALYLDENTQPIDADLAVQLYTWPARSADQHVATLAKHLLRPLISSESGPIPSNQEPTHSKSTNSQSIRTDTRQAKRFIQRVSSWQKSWRKFWHKTPSSMSPKKPPKKPLKSTRIEHDAIKWLAGIGVAVGLFTMLVDFETIEQPRDQKNPLVVTESFNRQAPPQVITPDEIEEVGMPEQPAEAKSSAQIIPQPVAAKSTRPKPIRQTISPCASGNELLRGNLRWQFPTDLEPCAD